MIHYRKTALGLAMFSILALVTPKVLAEGQRTPPNVNCPIKGNISRINEVNNVKRYHLPGMRYYNQTLIDTSRGERWFCSEREAIAAGWHKAPN